MGLQHLLTENCNLVTSRIPTGSIPRNIFPTHLQQSVPHPSWIDIFPDPRLRDNLILAQGSYDEDLLFNDLVGALCTEEETALNKPLPSDITGESEERKGLVVWSNPWDINSWEITPGFMKRWARLVQGCEELMASSNRWRACRQEDALENVRTHHAE